MPSIASLFVNLSANSAAFKTDMDKAARAVNSSSTRINKFLGTMDRGFLGLRKSVANSAKSMISFRGAMASLIGAGGFGLMVKQSLDMADSIGKTADKLGISTAALQEYRIAADLSGIAQNNLDTALQRFTRRSADANKGNAALKATFDTLGVSLQDAAGNMRPTEDLLNGVADGLSKVQNPAERLRLAFQLFDTEGVAMVNLLRDGSAGLEEVRQKVRDLGLVIDDDLIRKSESAKDRLTLLGAVIKTKVTVEILRLAPQINDLADKFTKALPNIIKATGVFIELADGIGSVFSILSDTYDLMKNGGFDEGTGGAALFGSKRERAVREEIAVWDDLQKQLNLLETKGSTGNNFVNLSSGNSDWSSMANKAEKSIESLSNTTSTMANLTKSSTERAGAEYDSLGRRITSVTEDIKDTTASSMSGVEDSLLNAAATGKASFKDMTASIINDLARITIRRSVTNPLANVFGGVIDSFFSGGGGSTSLSSIKPVSTPTATAAPLPARARGGPVIGGNPYLVGERGPELFVPNSSGGIVPNNQMGGGMVVNQTIHLSAGVPQAVQAEVARMLPAIKSHTTAGVIEAIDRGGVMARKTGARR